MSVRQIPLWQEQAPMPPTLGADPLPAAVDVAIVGGGYTGLGAARRLAKLGLSAAVIERAPLGFGASSRNGGKALVGLKHDASKVVRDYGFERGEALWRASLEGIDMVERIVAEEGIECEFERTGSAYLACKPSHYSAMQRESEWLARHFNYERVDVDRADLADEIGTAAYYGATIDPPSAGLHPAKWVRGLAQAAAAAGATLCAGTEVRSIARSGEGHRLVTSRGELAAREILVATNGYTGGLRREIQRRVVPVGSYIIATEPLDAALAARLSPRRRMFYDSKWFLKYFRITTDGRMLFGGRTTISPDQDLTRSAALLRRDLVAMFPELCNVGITHSWSGQLGVTFDALPHIGRVDGLWYALGYGGHGVALSTLLADDVAHLIAGRRETSIFAEVPHKTHPLYRGRPWFRPLLGAGLRLLDRFS
ncbi:MAG: NAD(P)/FAD-dependent oxidoreductase [Gammaproteobacteria bacterium]